MTTFNDAVPSSTPEPSGDGYCQRSDIEAIFGADNVRQWADLDNDGDDDKITARINVAIGDATAKVNDRFRDSKYAVPLTARAGESLTTLTDVCARMAGVWLYETRGIDEQDEEGRPFNRMAVHRKIANGQIRRWLAGVDSLPAVYSDHGINAPFIVG